MLMISKRPAGFSKTSLFHQRTKQSGVALVEVLFTLFILLIGLLGLAALQLQVANANVESYQRAQAIILLNDMVERFNSTRALQVCYNFSSATTGKPYLGQAASDSNLFDPTSLNCTATGTTADVKAAIELASWGKSLKGSSETTGANSSLREVGALDGARGCIYSATDAASNMLVYTFAVAWQGTNNTVAPSPNAPCAKNLYGPETMRRVVWTTTRVAALN